jgi:hypothetical protein
VQRSIIRIKAALIIKMKTRKTLVWENEGLFVCDSVLKGSEDWNRLEKRSESPLT